MRASRSSWTFSLIIMITLAFEMQSQVSSFKHFGLDKSIFPSRIECISQAASGELLIGTLAGLVVYDGYTFRTLGVADGLSESSISSILVDGDEIILGHWAGNISKFFLEEDSIVQVPISKDLNFSSVKQMLKLKNGALWILSEEGRLFSYWKGNVERVLLPLINESEKVVQMVLQGNRITLVLESQIIQASQDAMDSDWKTLFTSKDQRFACAYQMNDLFWVLGNENGAFALNLEHGAKSALQVFEATKGFSIHSIEQGNQNELWLATKDRGALVLEISFGLVKKFNRDNGLSYNQVRDIFIDREKTIWIGTTAGLDQYLGDAFMLFNQPSDLSGSLIWDVLKVQDHLYALNSEGITKYAFNQQGLMAPTILNIDFESEEPRQIIYNGDDVIYVLGTEGGLWKGSYSSDLFYRLSSFSFQAQCMAFVGENLWVGTNDGVYIIDQDQPVEHLTSEVGLGGNRVTGIYHSQDKKETWITALGSETTLYSGGKFKKFGSSQGLSSSVLQDAAFDREGNIWFASYDKGVFYREGEAFKSVNESVKLTSPTTFAIAIDQQGIVWIGHNWGIDKYDHANRTAEWFGEDQGFMGVEVSAGSIIIDGESRLWMGTLMGILRFDPHKIVVNDIACLLDIRHASLGAQNLLDQGKSSFILSSNNDLMVNFKGISLQNPAKNKFMYRLKGAHENWRTLSTNQPIEYLSLPIGDFQFELKAYNNSGVCSDNPVSFEFSIMPPFYRTWWFYTIVFLLLIMLVVFMDRIRVVNLLEQNRALEEKLSIKDQELIEMDEERTQASSALKADLTLVKALEQREKGLSQLEKELFPSFSVFSDRKADIGSHGIITLACIDFRLVLFTDVHIDGISAHAIRANLKATIWDRIPREYKPADISNEVAIAISSLEKNLGKFKGINWFLCLDNFTERLYFKSNMSLFTFSHGSADEVGEEYSTSSKQGFKIPSNAPMLVCSASLFEQLNESGTKPYSKSRVLDVLKHHQSESKNAIALELLNDVKNWRGAMEQFNDVEFYFWNHE